MSKFLKKVDMEELDQLEMRKKKVAIDSDNAGHSDFTFQ